MDQLLDSIKPDLDAINQMYKVAFEEGRRSMAIEMRPVINRLQEAFDKFYTDFKQNEAADLFNQQGEIHHGTQSRQT